MRIRYFLALLGVLVLAACTNSEKEPARIYAESNGNINNLQIVMSNDLWEGRVGEAVRSVFAAPVDGLPQDEPMYNMNQIPPSAFSGFAKYNRTFVQFSQSDSTYVRYANNPYAKPQLGVFVGAPDKEGLINILNEKSEDILAAIKATEIAEKQRRINKSLMSTAPLQEKMGVNMMIPTAYRVAKEEDNFLWIRKDIRTGSLNIIVYEVGLDAIDPDGEVINNIIKLRDSIGGDNVTVDEGGRFITEEAYAPFIFESEIDGKFAYETKGTWEVRDKWMAGPFVNYAIRDEANNRYLIVEGFTFAPSIDKRDYQFELEAILKSLKFENKS
ncbi:DUF4837 family protein [Gilvibacter sp.]|uniref:DUF4837 family protein n=1 Tax=Gilvibacter sp. TaxID=2729997 RepID=UPI0025C6466A|nr:DUF4837 family protein [Gilvibacter sp.]NQX78491.1 DUF4837 family protein [Gilvibacter sp.]